MDMAVQNIIKIPMPSIIFGWQEVDHIIIQQKNKMVSLLTGVFMW